MVTPASNFYKEVKFINILTYSFISFKETEEHQVYDGNKELMLICYC